MYGFGAEPTEPEVPDEELGGRANRQSDPSRMQVFRESRFENLGEEKRVIELRLGERAARAVWCGVSVVEAREFSKRGLHGLGACLVLRAEMGRVGPYIISAHRIYSRTRNRIVRKHMFLSQRQPLPKKRKLQ